MNCRKCKAILPDDAIYCCYCGIRQEVKKRTKRANGEGCVYKRNGKYVAVYTDGRTDGKQNRKFKYGFTKRSDAIEWLEKRKYVPDQVEKSKTLKDLYDLYSNGAMLKISADKQSHYRTAWKRLSPIANIEIDKIGIKLLQDTVDNAVSTYYPAKDMKQLCARLFERGMAEKVCTVDLSQFIVVPDNEEKKPIPLTEDEILQLWEDYEKGNRETGYYIMLMHTGMMPGELRKLYPEQIDLENKFIYGCGIKTKKRKETAIGIADILVPVIEELSKTISSTGRFYPHGEKTFYKEWEKIKKRAKINPKVTPYGCRHTFGTVLSERNVANETIREAMRHTQFSTTKRYIHKSVDADVLEAVNKF